VAGWGVFIWLPFNIISSPFYKVPGLIFQNSINGRRGILTQGLGGIFFLDDDLGRVLCLKIMKKE